MTDEHKLRKAMEQSLHCSMMTGNRYICTKSGVLLPKAQGQSIQLICRFATMAEHRQAVAFAAVYHDLHLLQMAAH